MMFFWSNIIWCEYNLKSNHGFNFVLPPSGVSLDCLKCQCLQSSQQQKKTDLATNF